MFINEFFEYIKTNFKKQINNINKNKELIGFNLKDEKILLVCYSNEIYKKFILDCLNKFLIKKDTKNFLISSNKNEDEEIYKELSFYKNLAESLKSSTVSTESNIVTFEDFEAFLSDEKTFGVIESIFYFKKEMKENTKCIIIFTDKKETIKYFCKSTPSFIRIGFIGCLAEIACYPAEPKSPEEAIEEFIQTEQLLGEKNED